MIDIKKEKKAIIDHISKISADDLHKELQASDADIYSKVDNFLDVIHPGQPQRSTDPGCD